MSAADRHREAEGKRLGRIVRDKSLSDFERADAQGRLARLNGAPVASGWVDKAAICRWCERPIETHTPANTPRTRPAGQSAYSPSELGATLCPVVVSISVAGKGPGERYYPTPTEEQARAWREANRPDVPRKRTKAEVDAERRERRGRQGSLL